MNSELADQKEEPVVDAAGTMVVAGTFSPLAVLPTDAMVDESGMAKAFGVATRTIRRMVTRGELPPPIRFGGKAVWLVGRVTAWITAMAEREEAEAKRRLEKIRLMGA